MKPETIIITNFGGRLTRILNGDLNSGFAKFATSFGYDPISKPGNLTWMERPQDITGVNDLVLDGKVRFIGETNPTAYLIGSTGKLWKVQIVSTTNSAVHSVVGIHSVLAGSATYAKGGSMEFFGTFTGSVTGRIFVGNDTQVNVISTDGTGDAVVGSAANYAANAYRPLKQIAGKLVFGNGNTVGVIDATGTVTSSVVGTGLGNIYSALVPPLPVSERVQDMDNSPSNDYMLIASAEADYENVSTGTTPNLRNVLPADSRLYYWNGTDATITAATTLATNLIVSLQSYLQGNHLFASDSSGAGLFKESQKILTLPKSKSPLPGATGVNGQFLFWSCPERVTDSNGDERLTHTMYYFGSLDQESPPGLYRIMREFAAAGNAVETPFNRLVSVAYNDLNTAQTGVSSVGSGTHYFSTRNVATSGASSTLGLQYFTVPPTGARNPALGVYETQTQMFAKRVHAEQIRVYTEPTAANNAFKLEIIGADGAVVTNGTFTYTFAAGTDITKLQGALERINFNPTADIGYGLGIRITNTGTAHMTFKKIEVDVSQEGK